MAEPYHFSYTLALVGDPAVGKTQLLMSEEGDLTPSSPTTNAVMPIVHHHTRSYHVHGRTHRVQLWDLPGAQRSRDLIPRFCAGVAGVIFVFDATDQATIQHLEDWMSLVSKHNARHLKFIVAKVTGNKRAVTTEQGMKFADKMDAAYFEILNGEGISEMFNTIIAKVDVSIPKPPEPSKLMKRGIQLGSIYTDANNLTFRKALFQGPPSPSRFPSGLRT